MTTQPALIAIKKETALEVIGHMLAGMTTKAACETVGISTQAFGKTVSDYPELVADLNKIHVAKVSAMMGNIYGEAEANMEAMLKRSRELRFMLDDQDNMVDKYEVLSELMKIDKYLQNIIAKLTPVMDKAAPQQPKDDRSAIDADRILKDFQGADLHKVSVTITAERTDFLRDDGTIIDGVTSDQTPTESQAQDAVPLLDPSEHYDTDKESPLSPDQ